MAVTFSKIRTFLFLILCSGTLSAQSFKSTVNDSQTGLPVSDVYVRVLNSSMATVTDGNGVFEFSGLPSKPILFLSAIGFESAEREVTDSTSVITLQRSSIYLNSNITITARRFEANQYNISEGVTIVDSRAIRESSARSTPEILMGETGVWVQKTNLGSGSPVIRGLMGNQVLLMVDGIRMNNATYRYGPNQYLSTIDPGMIERVEAIRGNGSVLYGSDALGGVVQVLTRTPHFQSGGRQIHGLVSGKWMSSGMEKSIRSEVQWNKEKIAALAGFSRRSFGDIVAGGSLGKLAPTGYDEFSADGKMLFKTGARGVLTAVGQHHEQNSVPRYDQVEQGGYRVYKFDPQIRQLGYLRWETFTNDPLAGNIEITGGIHRSVEGITSQKEGSPETRTQKDIVNTFNGIAEVHSALSSAWQAQSGFEWYYDVVSSSATIYDTDDQEVRGIRGSYADGATSTSMAIFSSHNVDIEKLNLSAGVRFNVVSLSVNDATFGDQKIRPHALVGNLGLAYTIDDGSRFFVSGNTGFRAPNVDDVSKFGTVESTVFEIPSKNLSPERSRSVEAGIKVNRKKFTGSLTAYRTTLFDLIERLPVSYQGKDTIENRRVYQKRNISESVLSGFEAEGAITVLSHIRVTGNITYTYGENVSKDEPMRRIPPLFGRFGVRYEHTNGFWVRVDYVAAGEQGRLASGDLSDGRISVRLKDGVMPSWNVFNVHTGFSYKALSLTVRAENIFDEGYRIYASGVDAYGRNMGVTLSADF